VSDARYDLNECLAVFKNQHSSNITESNPGSSNFAFIAINTFIVAAFSAVTVIAARHLCPFPKATLPIKSKVAVKTAKIGFNMPLVYS